MICWACGHLKKHHYPVPNYQPAICLECQYNGRRNNYFFRHEFEDNLAYIERKAKEKENSCKNSSKCVIIKYKSIN